MLGISPALRSARPPVCGLGMDTLRGRRSGRLGPWRISMECPPEPLSTSKYAHASSSFISVSWGEYWFVVVSI